MPNLYGYSRRVYKKKYKRVLTQVADKISSTFANKAEKRKWISRITNARMNDLYPRN